MDIKEHSLHLTEYKIFLKYIWYTLQMKPYARP